MVFNRRRAGLLALLALLGMFATPASAGIVVADLLSTFGNTVERSQDFGANYTPLVNVGTFTMRVQAGTTDPGPFLPNWPNTFLAICMEPNEGIYPGENFVYTVSPLESGDTLQGPIGLAKANQLRELFGFAYPVFGTPISLETAVALQIATWEIVRETTSVLDATDGRVRFQNPGVTVPNAITLANTFLAQVDGNGPFAEGLTALTTIGNQDLLVQTIPEPGTLVLLGGALVGLAFFRRRK